MIFMIILSSDCKNTKHKHRANTHNAEYFVSELIHTTMFLFTSKLIEKKNENNFDPIEMLYNLNIFITLQRFKQKGLIERCISWQWW